MGGVEVETEETGEEEVTGVLEEEETGLDGGVDGTGGVGVGDGEGSDGLERERRGGWLSGGFRGLIVVSLGRLRGMGEERGEEIGDLLGVLGELLLLPDLEGERKVGEVFLTRVGVLPFDLVGV